MPPHANKNVHKPWNEGRDSCLSVTLVWVCMITHPTNRAVMARDDPLLRECHKATQFASGAHDSTQNPAHYRKHQPVRLHSPQWRGTTSRRGQVKCDGTRAETIFRLSAKRTSPFKSAGGVSSIDYWPAEVCASAVVMLDTPCSEVVWRVLATQSIRQ